jgi:hypothetical protein
MTAIGRIMAPGGLAVLLLAGCNGSPKFDYAGTWTGMRPIEGRPGADPDVLRSIGRVELRIDERGHFALLESGLAKEGTVEKTARGAALPVEMLMGRPLDRQPEDIRRDIPRFELVPQADGALRFIDPRRPKEETILRREAKPRT